MKRLILTFFILLALSASPASAYWIWTPKTGKWVNPKRVVKPTPKEQLDLAKGLYEAKKYEEAKREFNKLLRSYPKSVEAAESQYYLALIEEAEGSLYEAYKAYQKVIDKYPFSERIQEIIEREYKIAEAFMSGKARKALTIENPAIEIFSKVVENSSYGPLAAPAQYKLGMVLKGLLRYYEAEEAFNKVISNYPDSEWAEASKFQIAACRASLSRSPDYDQWATNEAKERFEKFLQEHPDAALSGEAEKNIALLKEKEAQSSYDIARFYEKQKEFDAARVYYNNTINSYPDSAWAVKAMERLQIMDRAKK